MKQILIALFIALNFFAGCHKPDVIATGEEHILYDYVDEFIEEASKRGIDLTYIYDQPITMAFADEDGFCGRTYGENKKRIEIYIGRPCWGRQDVFHQRATVFHELGHDVLGLKHDEGIIMKSRTNRRIRMEERGWTWTDVLNEFFGKECNWVVTEIVQHQAAVRNSEGKSRVILSEGLSIGDCLESID